MTNDDSPKMKAFYSLSDFPDLKGLGKNYVATCPKCGKKHLSISKATGLMHCFYAGCGFKGKLREYWTERPLIRYSYRPAEKPARQVVASAPNDEGFSASEVPMIPSDYKSVSPEIVDAIKPLDDRPDTSDKEILAVRRYLADQHISLKTAIEAGVGCLSHRCYGKEGEKNSSMRHCIAYINYVNGQPVNVKYRSCEPVRVQKKAAGAAAAVVPNAPTVYTKLWSQDSPTTPCAPYNIDCINPLKVAEECIPRLIIVEGEKDVLSVREAGYHFVISVPNGAASDLAKCFEAFVEWFAQVKEIVICGDTDLPGRTLVSRLGEYFGDRGLFTTLPGDCKDISDVLLHYGAEVVREIIDSAQPMHTADIITVEERCQEVLGVLHGKYDHGYSVGYGPLTDHIFFPTDQGGLIIVTGKPNCGKTDFLNDLTCRIMAKTGRNVCFLSFEVPDKDKHIAHMVRLMMGMSNLEAYSEEQLRPTLDFLNRHMTHLDLHEVPPTPQHILLRADMVRKKAPLHYLIIDPYLFMEVETGKNTTETQAIKTMLTQLQAWGRVNHVWVIVVAHPRKLQKLGGGNELESIDMYTIAGSANWANLADFIISLSRVEKETHCFTKLDMLKVRDQELCSTGNVLYVRQPCGRYDERESEDQILQEAQGKVMDREWESYHVS